MMPFEFYATILDTILLILVGIICVSIIADKVLDFRLRRLKKEIQEIRNEMDEQNQVRE